MGSADRRELPIVVGGCHRSGTSLVRRLLDSHSAIHCGPELPFFRDFFGNYDGDPYAHLRFSAAIRSVVSEAEALRVLGSAFLTIHEVAASAAGKRRWADKSPDNVVHLADWESLLRDRWLFVFVVRNPLDTLASMSDRPFPLTLPRGLLERTAHYLRYVEAGLHYLGEHPHRTQLVVYEQLVTEPEVVLSDLMAGLGEDFEPSQVNYGDAVHQDGLEDPEVRKLSRPQIGRTHRWAERLGRDDGSKIFAATERTWARIDPTYRWVRPEGAERSP